VAGGVRVVSYPFHMGDGCECQLRRVFARVRWLVFIFPIPGCLWGACGRAFWLGGCVPIRPRGLGMRRLVGKLAFCSLLLCVACGSKTQAATLPPVPAYFPSVDQAAACDSGYTALPLAPENVYEEWLAPSLRVCYEPAGDGFSLEFFNGAPAVWVIDGVAAPAAEFGFGAAALFRFIPQPDQTSYPLLPGQKLPLSNVSAAFVNSLEIHLDPVLQAEWETVSRGVQAIEDKTHNHVLNSLEPDGKAVVACAQSIVHVANSIPSANTETNAYDVFDTIYSDVQAEQPCQDAINTADAADAKAGRPEIEVHDLDVTAAPDTETVERAEEVLISADALESGLDKFIEKAPVK
jgi:hypothetical protein